MQSEVDLVAEETKRGRSQSRIRTRRTEGGKRDERDLLGDERVRGRSLRDVLELDGSLVSNVGSEDVVDEGERSLRGRKREVQFSESRRKGR